MASKTLTFKRVIQSPVAEVYRLWTRASAVRLWFCDAAQIEPRKGGRAYFGWNSGFYAAGQMTQAEPNKTLAFTWLGLDEPAASRVKVTFKDRAGATTVTVVHTGIGTGPTWAGTAQAAADGWNAGLENLQSVLETGEDLRIVRRPMLGIMGMNTLDAEAAQKLGVPVTEGISIGGTVPGMGAEAAGLQKDDVVVSIGGKKTNTFGKLQAALAARRAGDTVPVVFYRGSQKLTRPMTLSRRPLPAPPTDGPALAAAARAIHEREMAALEAFLADVAESEAGRRPAPAEWSVKEMLAHVLNSERSLPDVVAEVLTDSGRWNDDFDNENVARNAGTLAIYPSLAELVQQIRHAHAEQEAMFAAIPAEVFAKPRMAWQLAWNLLQSAQTPSHIETHLPQMREALAAARQAPG